ncbi:MAG: nucleoside monophosphate kinase [Luteolibacter sp.]
MALRVVLLGPPASGKGTQGRRLADSTGVAYLSTGALLREAVEDGTPLGLQAKPILDQGGYLPDDLMCGILGEWLERYPDGWVLDGFPRSVPQAVFLDEWLADHAQSLDRVIALDAPLEELLQRIIGRVECPECRWTGQASQAPEDRCPVCGAAVSRRDDDDETNFRRRHAAYTKFTVPLLDYYQTRGILSHMDATSSADDVSSAIRALFDPTAAG